jgi:hypothetical protein
VAASDDYLIDLVVDMGFVTRDQVESVRPKADETGEGVVDLLIADKSLRPAQVAQAKAAHFNVEFVNLADMRIADDVLAAVNGTWLKVQHGPVARPKTRFRSP